MQTAQKTPILTKITQTGKKVEVFPAKGYDTMRQFEVVLDGVSGGVTGGPFMAVVKGVSPNPTVIKWADKLILLTAEEAKRINDYRTPAEIEASEAFARNVPGLKELDMAYTRMDADHERYDNDMAHLMDEDNDGARYPSPTDDSLRTAYEVLAAQYPRAELYRRARAQSNSAHWTDTSGKGAAGDKAMRILRDGGSIEDALAALAERNPINTWA